METLYTLSQAAKKLNVSNITVCNWANEGKIDFISLPGSGRRRYKIDTIIQSDEKKSPKLEQVLSTQEFLQKNSQTILKDKLDALEKNTQNTDLSKTLEAELIINGKDFTPWWTQSCKEMSQKLWLPIETEYVDSVTKYSNLSLENTVQNSWFSITKKLPDKKKWLTTYSPLLPSFHVGQTVLENTKRRSKKNLKHKKRKKIKRKKIKEENLQRTYIFKIWPTTEQKLVLKEWFGTARYCYNQIISRYIENPKLDLTYSTRDLVLKEIPFDHEKVNLEVKREAIQEAFNTISSGADSFNYRSKKDKSESIAIRSACVSELKNTIFSKTFNLKTETREKKLKEKRTESLNLKGKKLFKPELEMGGKLIRRNNKYYIHLIKKKESQVPYSIFKDRQNVCALDPGTGTFNTYYSPESCGKIAPEAGNVIFRNCLNIDRLVSKASKLTGRKRYNIKKAITRARNKIINKITDLHWKAASFLCNSFNNIFLPNFETKNMANKAKRKISSKTARSLLTLSHYKFSQRLKSKAEEKCVSVIMVDEPYTSQICGGCFNRNAKLKLTERIYKCKNTKCENIEIDRDVNGARNILLRSLGLLEYKDLSLCTMAGTPSGFF